MNNQLKKHKILEPYTNDQLCIIKEAVFKISDAYWSLKELSEDMASKRQWHGQGDIAHIVEIINDRLVGDEGLISQYLSIL